MLRLSRGRLSLGVLYGGLAALFCGPLFEFPHGVGSDDWDQHLFYYASVLKSIVEYGSAPFWNPWYCGGNVLWANPQVALISPVYPLALITSLPLAMKFNILLHYWIGLAGMHILLRRVIGVTVLAPVVYLACVFVFSGAPALHLAVGHSTFLPVFYLPIQLYCVLQATRTGRLYYAFGAAVWLALMIYSGGMHVVPMALIGIGCLGVLTSWARQSWRPLVVILVVVCAGFAYAGPKVVPMARFIYSDSFLDDRNDIEDRSRVEWTAPETVPQVYLNRDQHLASAVSAQQYGWHEYGNYTGALFGFLFLSSLVWVAVSRAQFDRRFGLATGATAVFLLVLSVGEFAPLAPASLIKLLPFFSSFRIPSRFTIVFVLFAVVTVAWVWRRLTVETLGRSVGRFVAVVCVLASADLVTYNQRWFDDAFSGTSLPQSFRWFDGPDAITVDTDSDPHGGGAPMLRALFRDRAFFNCYEPLQLVQTSDSSRPLVYTDGGAQIFETWFDPNTIEFSVLNETSPSLLFLNVNFSPGWRSTLGLVAADASSGLATVTIPAALGGRHYFSFFPDGLWLGIALLVLAVVGSASVWRRTLPEW